jgi:hypothetical protein
MDTVYIIANLMDSINKNKYHDWDYDISPSKNIRCKFRMVYLEYIKKGSSHINVIRYEIKPREFINKIINEPNIIFKLEEILLREV